MKRLAISLLAGVASVGFFSAAQAADLIIEEPAPVAIVDLGGNWDGVYVGAFAGFGWGTLADDGDLFGDDDFITEYDSDGWLLGVNAGADFTVSEAIVAGIVGDIAWTDIGNSDVVDFEFGTDWAASLRGKLGFDGGAFLPYLTGGLAMAGASASFDADSDGVDDFEDSQTHVGWTIGAGVEFALAENISVDLLYRFSDYGSEEYDLDGPVELGLSTHTVTAGVNFRF